MLRAGWGYFKHYAEKQQLKSWGNALLLMNLCLYLLLELGCLHTVANVLHHNKDGKTVTTEVKVTKPGF